jgi:hypothetical protein
LPEGNCKRKAAKEHLEQSHVEPPRARANRKKGKQSPHEDDRATHDFKYLHDLRLVRSLEVSGGAALQSDLGQLVDRFF